MKKSILAIMIALALILGLASLTGCGRSSANNLTSYGVLVLSVNPEIAIEYDENGIVTGITARNDDAKDILKKNGKDLIGLEIREVITKLVAVIGEAGYFIEEVEGKHRQIVIEIETGSQIPNANFLDEIVSEIREYINMNDWNVPIDVKNESDYGLTDYKDKDNVTEKNDTTDYDDTDYGPKNDGVNDYDDTDYGSNNDGVTDYDDTDYGPNNDGVTDYDDTDYGPNNDGATDYDDTDYGPNNDGVTDYHDTDYGPNNDGVTDYDDTDYGPNNDGVTDYHDTDYGPNNDGVTDYDDTDYGPNNDGVTDYNYNNNQSDYDDSDYGDSGYSDYSDYDD